MAKKTVFTGVINGETFNNVADYNARMNELLSQGVENISAASSTEIRNVDENVATSGYVSTCTTDQCPGTCTSVSTSATTELPEDEDLSFYPYHEDDDPHYLDLLATSDHATNVEAYNEAINKLEKCFPYIIDTLNDNSVTNENKRDYLLDVKDILNTLATDADRTNVALDKIYEKRNKLDAEFEKVKAEYEKKVEETYVDEEVLNAALNVINLFDNFYRDVEEEVIKSIATIEGTTKCSCKCDKVETSVKEAVPQKEISDFNKLFERIFGPLR